MKLFLLALVQLALAWAYSVSEGSVKVGSQVIEFGEFNTQEIKHLDLSYKDTINVNLKLDEEQAPHQVVLSFSNGNGLDWAVVPAFTKGAIKASVPAAKLPAALAHEEKVHLTLIVADASGTLQKNLGELVPSDNLRESVPYVKPATLASQPQIAHTFRTEEKTVGAAVPLGFIAVAGVLFLGLLGSWTVFIGGDLTRLLNHITRLNLLHNVAFLGTLVGFEATFAKYYLGTSIFQTLASAAALAPFSLYFGLKVLRNLAYQRRIGNL